MSKKVVSKYVKNILIWLDQGLNTLTFGDPDETVSSRLGKSHRGDFGQTIYYITFLPWLIVNIIFYPLDGWDHCKQSIEEDEGKGDLLNESSK